MSKFTDQNYLKTDQYKDATNLNARVTIHDRFSTNPYGWFRWVFDTLLVRLPADSRILELGSGPGLLWKSSVDRIPAGWKITISDLSPGMLDTAWRNLVVTGRAFQFREIDAQTIPFEDDMFDAVIANHMLYHVPDRAKALAEIKRVLKPGGHLIATTAGEKHLHEILDWFKQIHESDIWESFVVDFTLENGMEQLKPYFTQVALSCYEDNLQVTEIQPLMDYILSTIKVQELPKDKLELLRQNLEKELEEKGSIFITKDSGLFEAIK
jgi:ubiquinone/menaquinone biosynthesis C-methylase UbiE